jgi:hypothetical protein
VAGLRNAAVNVRSPQAWSLLMSCSRRSLCHGDGSVFAWLTEFLSDHLSS